MNKTRNGYLIVPEGNAIKVEIQLDLENNRKRVEALQLWLMDKDNIMHPDFEKKSREQRSILMKIAIAKQKLDPHQSKDVHQDNYIIHPIKP